MELPLGGVVNLGIGMPEGVAAVAAEEGLLEHVTLTAEPGVIGGMPQGGLDFGAALNPQTPSCSRACSSTSTTAAASTWPASAWPRPTGSATSTSPSSARASPAPAASSTSARTPAAWCSPAPSPPAGSRSPIEDGRLRIAAEGRQRKFVEAVEQITFSGELAAETGQPVLYVTERCVFTLEAKGLQLIEIAPGIDLDRDILAHMAFRPHIGTAT